MKKLSIKQLRYRARKLHETMYVGGKRVKRKNRTTGLDLCSGCYSFHCDPMSMSRAFKAKVDRRRAAGLCVACGHKPCTCKRKQ